MRSDFGQLIAAAQRGDEHAFGLLWRATNPGLRRYLRVVAPEHADSVAASTWLELVRRLRKFGGSEASWSTLVFDTARRCRGRAGDQLGPRAGAQPASLMQQTLAQLVTDVALDLLAALPAIEREVVVLRSACRLSVEQTAKIMKVSPASVRAAAHSGLARAGDLALSREYRDRIDHGEPVDQAPGWWRAGFVAGLGTVDTAFEDLLSGRPVRPGAPRRVVLLAAILAAACAPPAPSDLIGSGPAYAAFRRHVAEQPRHARGSLRLGSRAAILAATGSIGFSGTVIAAYAGALPGPLQDAAHHWFKAPAGERGGEQPNAPRTGGPAGSGGPGQVPSTVPATGRGPGRSGIAPGRAGGTGSTATDPVASADSGAPAGSSRTPPGATKTPPGATKTPPGATKTPPGASKTPPGSTKSPPVSSKTPPGSTRTPPGATKTRGPAPGSTRAPPGVSTARPPGTARSSHWSASR